VLSFPSAHGAAEAGVRQTMTLRRHALGGDIAISIQRARAQASGIGHDLLTEVKVLILHGMLHLAGHDHESDRGQMRRLEQKLRAGLNLPDGLIERAAAAGRSSRRRR
jgi:probable rRNA maturation factor